MKKSLFIFILLYFSIFEKTYSQWEVDLCGTVADPNALENKLTYYQLGGKEITSEGVINVPVIFVQFADEYKTSEYWPIGQAPAFMNSYIDTSVTQNSSNYGNITNFYKQMSMNRLRMIGKAYHFVTRLNRNQYPYISTVHQEIIERLDSIINFSEFDNWRFNNFYNHSNQPDGKVDMVMFIHRTFEQSWAGIKTSFINTTVDNGQRSVSTGFTCTQSLKGDAFTLLTSRHEFAHYLLTDYHPYDGMNIGRHNIWSLLEGTQNCLSINSYERYRLGWIAFTDISGDSLQASLSDYLTTGVAYRMLAPGTTDEYFAFENHQKVSIYDDASLGNGDKGIQIFHFKDIANVFSYPANNIDALSADGNWTLPNIGKIHHPWSSNPLDSLPLFSRGTPNIFGYDIKDKLPTIYSQWPNGHSVYAFKESNGSIITGRIYDGENYPYHAFKLNHNTVWSQWSNPRSVTFNNQVVPLAFELQSENNGIINIKFYKTGGVTAAPSKPFLSYVGRNTPGSNRVRITWYKSIEPDIICYEIWRGWSNSPTILPTTWYLKETVTDTSYIEDEFTIGNGSNGYAHYKIKAKDTQNKYSVFSNSLSVGIGYQLPKDNLTDNIPPVDFDLKQNYPNPFNPSTSIQFALPTKQYVNLKIYNLLGQEIKTLIREDKQAGYHTVSWDGKDNSGHSVSSGIYLYRLETKSFIKSYKMLLVK